MSELDSETPWYRDGLSFTCTQCGACCTGAPGYVWVNDEEIALLAARLQLSVEEFASKHLRRVGDRLSLLERPNGDCEFWSPESGCTVYSARPIQCRTWPFWEQNLESPADWEDTRQVCPGSRQGRWHSMVEIQNIVSKSRI